MKVPQKLKSGLRNVFNKLVKDESTADIARKPEAIKALMEFSAASFDTSAEGYADTLAQKLARVKTADLEYLKLKGVAVGIDSRLDGQKKGVQQIDAIFYSKGDKGGVIALNPVNNPVYKNGNAYEAVGKMAEMLRPGNPFKDGEVLYAAFIAEVYGRVATTETRWMSPAVIPTPLLTKNGGLKKPPVLKK